MNYYEHHLGDWAAATGHLSWDEDMAYTRLLRAYYHAERAIPQGQQYRLAKASTPAQRRAVDAVLEEFFSLADGAYHQKRADAEIASFHEKEPDRDAKKENERERQRRSRERRKELFNQLRDRGIVPDYDAPMHELQALASRLPKRDVTRPVTRDATGTHTQTPDTIPKEVTGSAAAVGLPSARASSGGDEGLPEEPIGKPSPAAAVGQALKRAGMDLLRVNLADPRLTELLAQGATPAEFEGVAIEAMAAGGKGWPWVLTVVGKRRVEAAVIRATPGVLPAAGNASPEPEWRRRQRERNEAAAGQFSERAVAEKKAAAQAGVIVEMEPQNAVAVRLG